MRTRLVLVTAVIGVTGTGLTAAVATPASRASRTPISRGAVLVAEEQP